MNSTFSHSLKSIILCISLLVAFNSFAQKDLDRNPVFFELAKKSIDYPRKATLSRMYGRIFAQFKVNRIGKVEDIQVFYPKMAPSFENIVGFGASIKKGLGKLPLLGLGYQGTYILPIAFVFTNYGESPQPLQPTNILPEFIETNNMTILTEIKVHGNSRRYSTPDFKNGFEPIRPSQQIAK